MIQVSKLGLHDDPRLQILSGTKESTPVFFNLLILKEVASPNHPIPITQSTPEKAPLYESEKYRQISHKTKVLLSALIGWLRVFFVGPVFHLLTLVAC